VLRHEVGSAPLYAVFGIAIMMILALGAIQVALTLYSGNVVRASAYEAARAAIEVDGSQDDARRVAAEVLRRSAGNLVDDASISIAQRDHGAGSVVIVEVRGRHTSLGPVPLTFPIRARASSLVEELPE